MCDRDRERRTGWAAERAALRPLPARPFDCTLPRMAVVSKTSLVTFDRNRYSVPCIWAGQTVCVKVSWSHVQVTADDKVLAVHERCYGRGQTVVDIRHYLTVLADKPRAAANALAVRRLGPVWTQARELLCDSRPDGYRELTAILMLLADHPPADVTSALEQALSLGRPTVAVVGQLLAACQVSPPDLGRYDALAVGGR